MGGLFERYHVEPVKGTDITIGNHFPEVFVSETDEVFCYLGICLKFYHSMPMVKVVVKDFHTCLDFLAVLIKILHRTFLLSDLFTHPHGWRREYKIKKEVAHKMYAQPPKT